MDKSRWSTLETSLIDSGDVSDYPYEPQCQAFINSIGRNEPMPLTDFDTAFETHRVVFAADQSADARDRRLSYLNRQYKSRYQQS